MESGTGASALSATQQAAATQTISLWDDLIAPDFTLATNGATANVKYMNTTTNIDYAQAYYPGSWQGRRFGLVQPPNTAPIPAPMIW